VRLLENIQLRREAERMATANLLSSEEKLTERQLQNYSAHKRNDRTAHAKLFCSVEKLTELQLHNSTTADKTFGKSIPI
jgi:hypothetical protein